jgi:hypothetical protein
MPCYFQGCSQRVTTTEHIPPKSLFPKDQRNQLLTVPSCDFHNNSKSSDDVYVLAHICLNASPSNRSREVFLKRVVPQLSYNSEAFRKTLVKDSIPLHSGAVIYKVNIARVDRFFDALSYGIIYKACGGTLPGEYRATHLYHNFKNDAESPEIKEFKTLMLDFYSGPPMAVLDFGQVNALNTTVYSTKIFGVSEFKSSITIVHDFFGVFRVTSMLTKHIDLENMKAL